MVRFLRADATHLSDKDIQEIVNAKNSMKYASEVMAKKYKISTRRVYQIWRGAHPPIDPSEISDRSQKDNNKISNQPQEDNKISSQALYKLYEKESKRDKKIIEAIEAYAAPLSTTHCGGSSVSSGTTKSSSLTKDLSGPLL